MNQHDITPELKAWLAEPAPSLDEHALYQTIDRIPSVPQRRRWWPFRWFPLGIGATRSAGSAESRPTRRNRSMFAATGAALGVAILAISGTLALIASPLIPVAPSVQVTQTAAFELPLLDEGDHFTGQMEFRLMTNPSPRLGDWSTLDDGTRVMRDAWFQTRWISTDERFDGAGEYTGESITYDPETNDPTRVLWMSLVLENEGGRWVSRPGTMGIWADGAALPVWFDGEGGYEGLSAFVLNTPVEYSNGHASLDYEGWIFPEDLGS